MVKREDSLRSVGLTLIATDKPTRAKLKALAEAEGLNLSEYLRKIASQGQPAMMSPVAAPLTVSELKRELTSVRTEVHRFLAALPMLAFVWQFRDANEFRQVNHDLADSMSLAEDMVVRKLAELPADARKALSEALKRVDESQQELKLG